LILDEGSRNGGLAGKRIRVANAKKGRISIEISIDSDTRVDKNLGHQIRAVVEENKGIARFLADFQHITSE